MVETAASIAALILVAFAGFQLALAMGAALGGTSWGGRHQGVLPRGLRIGSGIAVIALLLAAMIVLEKAVVIELAPLPDGWIGPATWAFAVLFALNTVGNFASQSRFERAVFGPITIVLVVALLVVAIG